MTSRRKTRRRRVKAWAVTDHDGTLLIDGFEHVCVYRLRRRAVQYAENYFPEFRVVPCTITFEAVAK